jgi:hypothetical protein
VSYKSFDAIVEELKNPRLVIVTGAHNGTFP